MSTVGIVPAAGRATRWGGYPKWLLPVGSGRWCIDVAVEAMRRGGADLIVVVTRSEWVHALSEHFVGRRGAVSFVEVDNSDPDMWASIRCALPFASDLNYLAMPDTLIGPNVFAARSGDELHWGLGLFKTDAPWRFGCVVWEEGAGWRVRDKDRTLQGVHDAWGVVRFDKFVAARWLSTSATRFVEVLNGTLSDVPVSMWDIGRYVDFATWDDYRRWVVEGASLPA